jgi:phosphatidate cytidylyltransferase
MLKQRLLVTIILIPIGIGLVNLGGWPFNLLITLFLGLAAWEYCGLFKAGGYSPSTLLVTGGAVILAMVYPLFGWAGTCTALTLLTLALMVWHLVDYERGRDQASTNFAISIGGIVYLGFIGSYLIALRGIEHGKWWFMIALPAVWFADAGAYFVGSRFGKHKMTPRLSPKKSWEGYIAGIFSGVLLTAGLAWLWHFADPAITPGHAALVALAVSVLGIFGDLGESMLKRQFNVKDSSNILPGHGGILDRIDSWLWAAVIGYYLAVWL